MKLSAICMDFETALYEACIRYIPLLTADLKGQSIYAFTILLNGLDAMGVAANTVENLHSRLTAQKSVEPAAFRLPHVYIQMNAAEWVHVNGHWDVFSPVNAVLDIFTSRLETHSKFDDLADTLNYDQISELAEDRFKRIIISVLQKLKNEGKFAQAGFINDVFLGVQHSDIGDSEIAVIEEVSNALNSKYWADRINEIKGYMLRASS